MRKISIKKISFVSLLTAAALILAYVESLFPPLITSFPGIKMGLPNIAIIFTLYKLGAKEAFWVSFIRLFFASLLFGSLLSMAYGFVGALLSLSIMVILKKLDVFSKVGVSVSGAILHNLGQVLVAIFVTKVLEIGYYMIFLTVSATIGGIIIGLAANELVKRIELKNI